MHNKIIILSIVLVLIVLFTQTSLAEFSIILNFDDAYKGVYEHAFQEMKKYNIPAVVFVITKYLGHEKHLSLKQLAELKSAGWEIGSHTINHYDLTTVIPEFLHKEIIDSKQILKNNELIDNDFASFCSPNGKWSPTIEKIVSANYTIARGNKLYIFNKTQNEDIIPKVIVKTTSINRIKQWIEEYQKKDQPLILVFHEVADGGNEFFFPPDKFKELLLLLKEYKISLFKDLI
ncbi:MAG: hypothetical protein FH762_12025 [Firmicutes bacterium]|nr:hypothetical protein [Bacillota bacterium]